MIKDFKVTYLHVDRMFIKAMIYFKLMYKSIISYSIVKYKRYLIIVLFLLANPIYFMVSDLVLLHVASDYFLLIF